MYSIGYPIWVDLRSRDILTPVEYSITSLSDDKVIYYGKVYAKDENNQILIDISDIVRNYIEVFYNDIGDSGSGVYLKNSGSINGIYAINTFRIQGINDSSVLNPPYEVTVKYDYNTNEASYSRYDYIIDDYGVANYPIINRISSNQLLYINPYSVNTGYGTNYVQLRRFNQSGNQTVIWSGQVPENTIGYGALPLIEVNYTGSIINLGEVGDIIRVYVTNNDISNTYSQDYILVNDCNLQYALVYVNETGGIDSLLIEGKSVVKYNNKRTNIKLYNDRIKRSDFENKTLKSDITKSYTLTTGYLSDEESSRMKHLLNSNKVWIQDFVNKTFTAVNITSNSYSVLNYENDKMFTYTINLDESQTYYRY